MFTPSKEMPFARTPYRLHRVRAHLDWCRAERERSALMLAGWLVRHTPSQSGTRRWTVLQGEAVGRPSRIELEADVSNAAVQAVRVGGASVMVSEATLRL